MIIVHYDKPVEDLNYILSVQLGYTDFSISSVLLIS